VSCTFTTTQSFKAQLMPTGDPQAINKSSNGVAPEASSADHRIKKTDCHRNGDRRDWIFSYCRLQAFLRSSNPLTGDV